MPEARRSAAAASPPSPARVYAVGVQCIATALGFFLTAVIKLPIPLYFPLSHRWSTTPNPEELSMDFYGRSLFAIVVGAVAGALTLAIVAVRSRRQAAAQAEQAPEHDADKAAPEAVAEHTQSYAGLTLLTAYAATALALGAGVFGYQLYGRPPAPEPLPPGLSTLQTAAKPTSLTPRPKAYRPAAASPAGPGAVPPGDDPDDR